MKKALVFVLICLLFTMSGCMGYREIDKGYLVTAMGFSNQNNSASVFVEAISSSDAINRDSKRVVLYGNGNSIKQAYKNLKSSLEKPLYFEQMGTLIFEDDANEVLNYLKENDDIYYGTYIVKTDDVKTLFENDTVNGVLGYDIISLIKTQQELKGIKAATQFYEIINTQESISIVNFKSGKLTIELMESK